MRPAGSTHGAPLRAGIVGAGVMGRWHAHAAARAGGRVAAIFDPDRRRAEHLAAHYGGCQAVADIHGLFEAADVVHICTPTASHLSLARQALEARRHALVEKPMAPTAADTLELLRTAARHGVLLCPVHQFVFQDGVQHALARRAAIGPLRHIDITVCSAGADGADDATRARVAREILPHPLSILQRLLPMEVSDLDWVVRSPVHGDLRAMAQAADATVSLLVSMSGRPTINRIQLIGARGTIDVDLFHGFAVTHGGAVSRTRKMTQPFAQAASLAGAAAANLARRAWRRESAYPGLHSLVQSFYDAVRERGTCPIAPSDTVAVARAWDRLVACSYAAPERQEQGDTCELMAPERMR